MNPLSKMTTLVTAEILEWERFRESTWRQDFGTQRTLLASALFFQTTAQWPHRQRHGITHFQIQSATPLQQRIRSTSTRKYLGNCITPVGQCFPCLFRVVNTKEVLNPNLLPATLVLYLRITDDEVNCIRYLSILDFSWILLVSVFLYFIFHIVYFRFTNDSTSILLIIRAYWFLENYSSSIWLVYLLRIINNCHLY